MSNNLDLLYGRDARKQSNTTREVLKPCPFCGGEATLEKDPDDMWYVYCQDIDCTAYVTGTFCTKVEAIEAWNRRVK